MGAAATYRQRAQAAEQKAQAAQDPEAKRIYRTVAEVHWQLAERAEREEAALAPALSKLNSEAPRLP